VKHIFYLIKPICFLFTIPITAIIILILLTTCNRQQPPIEIGLAINLSGRGGDAGEHIRNGALLAVRAINEAGGINGRTIELLIRDDKNTEKGVEEAARSLLKRVWSPLSVTTLSLSPRMQPQVS
jgi:hypothetical protein